MRAVMTRDEWTRLLSSAAGIVDGKSPHFSASCTLLEVGDSVRALATDTTIAVQSVGDAKKTVPGLWCLPAKELLERVRACPDGDVEVKVDKAGTGGASIKGGKRKFTISALDGREFPPVARLGDGAISVEVTAGALARVLGAVEFAIHPDFAGRFHTAWLRFGGDRLRADGMTSSGMATAWSPLPGCPTVEALVALKAAVAIRKLAEAEGEDDSVHVTVAGSMMRVAFASTELVFPLVRDQMQDLDHVLGGEPAAKVVVDRAALIDSVKSASVSVDKSIGLKSKGGELVIEGRGQHGDVTDSIPCEGDEARAWLPPKDLLLALGTLRSDKAEIGIHDQHVRIVDAEGERDVRHIRMQMVEEKR